ncbi:PadR family transcriptional regulator [Candidatus Bathyarchaeota archaeon]|nr:PadR family transcriptional regulator [Candidatus Bathyarchaeota archaeon]MBS7627458.1 PadR family transcriptional regulator [Candidatus Bathyarchaeota archaeon]
MLSEKPMYAYEVKKSLKQRFGFSPATITVYFVLYRMAKEGLVKKGNGMEVSGRPERRYYEITPKGLEAFKQGRAFIENILRKLS